MYTIHCKAVSHFSSYIMTTDFQAPAAETAQTRSAAAEALNQRYSPFLFGFSATAFEHFSNPHRYKGETPEFPIEAAYFFFPEFMQKRELKPYTHAFRTQEEFDYVKQHMPDLQAAGTGWTASMCKYNRYIRAINGMDYPKLDLDLTRPGIERLTIVINQDHVAAGIYKHTRAGLNDYPPMTEAVEQHKRQKKMQDYQQSALLVVTGNGDVFPLAGNVFSHSDAPTLKA